MKPTQLQKMASVAKQQIMLRKHCNGEYKGTRRNLAVFEDVCDLTDQERVAIIEEPVMNYHIQRLMWDEISKLKPKMIKVTSQFSKYFYSESVKWDELYDELPEDATVGEFDSIPVEIDDTIENKFYELVY